MEFPPPVDGPGIVSVYITEAYEEIQELHQRGRNLLTSEAPDGVRLKITADLIRNRCFPLLDHLSRMANVPRDWVEGLSACVEGLEVELREAARELQDIDTGRDRYVLIYAPNIEF